MKPYFCLMYHSSFFFFVGQEIGSHSHSHKHSHGPTVHASVQPSVEIPGDCKTEVVASVFQWVVLHCTSAMCMIGCMKTQFTLNKKSSS